MPGSPTKATTGSCIVCSCETSDKSHGGGSHGVRPYWHWRCEDVEECAVRRNARKRRPRPEAEIRARFRNEAISDAR